MKKYYFAIDVGGTSTKGGIIDENNNLLYKDCVKTSISENEDWLIDCIFKLIKKLENVSKLKLANASGLGLGIPGEIDAKNGVICVSRNIGLKNYKIVDKLEKLVNVPIKISNDANLAALAESKIGVAKNLKNFVMLTLGTGIGGDFFVNGLPFSHISPFSGEFGHIKVFGGVGKKCACGEYDCFELYGSTKALTKQIREAILINKNSLLWKNYNQSTVNAKAVFEYLNKDKTATDVFEKYISYLGSGIVSIINILMPTAVVIGGSISNQKEKLTIPLENYVNSHIYAKDIKECKVKILPAKLGADAGIYGAKNLFDEEV